MTQTINLYVVSGEKHATDRVLSLSRGSHVTVAGSGPIGEDTLQRIAAMRPHVCIISARDSESAYLECARNVLQVSPATKVLVFGSSDDPAVMARAAVSKVWNYVNEYVTYPEFVQAVTDAVAGKPASETGLFGKTAAALPSPATLQPRRWFAASPSQTLQASVRRCLSLGLTVDEIARHLGADVEVVRSHVVRLRRPLRVPSNLWPRVVYGTLAVASVVLVYKSVSLTWSLGTQRIAVSGAVRYAGRSLDTGAIEFRSLDSETAVVSGAVIQDGRYRIPARKGLLPGTYVVLITSPEAPSVQSASLSSAAAPPAAERIPESYNSASTQRVEVRRVGQNIFDFDIPRRPSPSQRPEPARRK